MLSPRPTLLDACSRVSQKALAMTIPLSYTYNITETAPRAAQVSNAKRIHRWRRLVRIRSFEIQTHKARW